MSSANAKPAGRSPLLFIFLTVFIDLLGFGIVIPLLPIYSKAFGASELELGLLFSCFSGMQFLFAPMWGRLSDRIGRRPVLIGGLVGTSVSYLLFASTDSVALHQVVDSVAGLFGRQITPARASMLLLYSSRLLAGFFAANISSAQAYIADVTTEKDRAKGMGLIGAAFGLGFTFGPLLGGILSKHAPGVAEVPRLPGYIAAALSLTAATFGFLKLPEPSRHKTGARLFSLDQVRHAFAEPRLGVLILLNFMNLFSFSCFEAMFTRYGIAQFPRAFHFPSAIKDATFDDVLNAAPIAGYYLFGIGIISATIQGGFIRRLVPKYGETRLVIVGPLLLGIALAIIGAAPAGTPSDNHGWWIVIVGCLLMPFGFGLTNPSVSGLISRASPGDRQGSYLGMNQSAASLARVLGPPFAGTLFALTPRLPFFAAATVLFLATAIAGAYRGRYAKSFEGTSGPEPAPVLE